MTYKDVLNKVSKDTGIEVGIIDKTYKSYWVFIRNTIQELPLKDNLSEDNFNRLKTNFNIPSLGKLSCTYNRYRRVKDKFNYIKKLRENNESTKEN
jgi:hypothetical protein